MNDEQLYAFVADARARVSNESRRRVRWLERQLREETSFTDICSALAEGAAAAEMVLLSGRRMRGRVTIAGTDFVQLTAADGMRTLLAAAAIVGVRVLCSENLPPGPTPRAMPPVNGHLIDELETLSERRCRVVICTRNADAVYRGMIEGVGQNIVWLDDATCYVRISMITDVTVLP